VAEYDFAQKLGMLFKVEIESVKSVKAIPEEG
jgi:hypothetical protein